MKASRGFSLLELMVTITIIAIIAGIAFPMHGYIKRQALSQNCVDNLHNLGLALNDYLADHNMRMPTAEVAKRDETDQARTIDEVLANYVTTPTIFHCPADTGAPGETHFDKTGSSYFWNSLLNGQSAMDLQFFLTDNEIGIPVLTDKENFHQGMGDEVNILYADGHVSRNVRFWVRN